MLIIPLIYQAFFTDLGNTEDLNDSLLFLIIIVIDLSPSPLFLCGKLSSLPEARIAFTIIPSLASADSRCVTSRLRKKPALVRYTYLQLTVLLELLMLTFEDVTTRGNYYPDKSMATAAVSFLSFLKIEANESCRIRHSIYTLRVLRRKASKRQSKRLRSL